MCVCVCVCVCVLNYENVTWLYDQIEKSNLL